MRLSRTTGWSAGSGVEPMPATSQTRGREEVEVFIGATLRKSAERIVLFPNSIRTECIIPIGLGKIFYVRLSRLVELCWAPRYDRLSCGNIGCAGQFGVGLALPRAGCSSARRRCAPAAG